MLICLHCRTKSSNLKITNINVKKQKFIPLLEVTAIIDSKLTKTYGNKNNNI